MEEKDKIHEEIGKTVRALGEWASQNQNRVALVVCGEFSGDSLTSCSSLVGRTDRVVRALYMNADETPQVKQVLELTGEMIKNPLLYAILALHEPKEDSDETESGLKGKLTSIIEAIANKFRKEG